MTAPMRPTPLLCGETSRSCASRDLLPSNTTGRRDGYPITRAVTEPGAVHGPSSGDASRRAQRSLGPGTDGCQRASTMTTLNRWCPS
jgi:hypothetical protein